SFFPLRGVHADGKAGRGGCRLSNRLGNFSGQDGVPRNYYAIDQGGDCKFRLDLSTDGGTAGSYVLPHDHRKLPRSRGTVRDGRRLTGRWSTDRLSTEQCSGAENDR